jgi:hypothetical protein
MQHRARAVELDERLRSLLEDAQTVPDDLRRVVRASLNPGPIQQAGDQLIRWSV